MHTIGISPKTILAFLFPALAGLGATLTSWAVTGTLDWTDTRYGLAGALSGLISALGAWLGHPGQIRPALWTGGGEVTPSDIELERARATLEPSR